MKHIKTLKIDIDKKNFEVIPSVQYDSNTRFLHIQLLNDSVPFDITGCSVILSGVKEDGNSIFNSCDVINSEIGFIEAEITEQMNAIPGHIDCEIKIYNGEGVLTSKKFTIKVTASQTSRAVVSSNEFKALTDALNKAQSIDNKAEKAEVEKLSSQLEQKVNENKMFEELNKKRDKSDLTKMKDLSQEVKEAMSGGSVAVVGVGSTSFVNLAADLTESLGEFNSIETNMNIGFMQTNGTLSTGNYGLYYTKLECNEGEQYSCDIRLVSSDGVLGIAFVNDEGSVISSLLSPNGSSVNEIGYKFSIPKDCKLLYLSTRNNYVNLKKVSALNVNEIKKDVVGIKDEISILPSLVNNVDKIIDGVSEKKEEEIQNITLKNGIYNYSNGVYQNFEGTSYTQYWSALLEDVLPGDILYVTCKVAGGNCRLAVFYDNNGNYLSYYNGGLDNGTFNKTKVVIPDNCYKVALTTFIPENNPLIVLKEVDDIIKINNLTKEVKENIEEIELLKFENTQLERRCFNLEKGNVFEWNDFDKAYFIFVIDDCNSFLPPCHDLFKSKNIPLSSAVIVDTLNTVYKQYDNNETRTVKTILNDMVTNNGEVLAHYNYDLFQTSTDSEWNTHVRDVKMQLENEGFNVRGLIRANNTTNNTEKGELYCRKYFDYSDGVGISTQYNLKRKFFIGVNSIDDMKAYIDSCCNKKGIFPFCFHGNRSDEPLATVENLSSLIDYIQSKGDKAEISTYSKVFDKFGTTNLEKRLLALENK